MAEINNEWEVSGQLAQFGVDEEAKATTTQKSALNSPTNMNAMQCTLPIGRMGEEKAIIIGIKCAEWVCKKRSQLIG